jgi:hypothetical protein
MQVQRNEKLRQMIVSIRDSRPCAKISEIAVAVGRSKQRVYDILKDEGRPTHYVKPKPLCLICGSPVNTGSVFCSRPCRQEFHRVPVACDNCGGLFTMPQSHLLFRIAQGQQSFCCSKPCRYEYWKKHYASRMGSRRKGAAAPELALATPGSH